MANSDVDEELDEPRAAELRGVTVHEISLVDRPANKRPFLLFKRTEPNTRKAGEDKLTETLTKEETEQIQTALNTEGEGETDKLEKIDGKSKNAAKAALRILQHLTDGMEADEMQKFLADAGFGFEKPVEKKEGDDSESEEAKAIAKRDAEIAKLPKEVQSILKADREAYTAENTELRKQVKEGADWRTEMIAEKDDDAVKKLVDEMCLPSMSEEDQIAFVKALAPELRTKLGEWAKGLNASKAFGDPTANIGTPRRGEHVVSAQEETMKRAEVLVKADTTGKLDIADAILKVRADDPALAEHSRRESLKGG